jgi:hypothetical protein
MLSTYVKYSTIYYAESFSRQHLLRILRRLKYCYSWRIERVIEHWHKKQYLKN